MTELSLCENFTAHGLRIFFTETEHAEQQSQKLLLKALQQYSGRIFTEEDIIRPTAQKPYLKDNSLYFSVTHSGGIWMVCIGPLPLGLDLQIHKEKYSAKVACRFFHTSEIALLKEAEKCGKDLQTFFDIWSARESYGKYTGNGVIATEKTFSTLDPPVPLYAIPFRTGYSLYLCAEV